MTGIMAKDILESLLDVFREDEKEPGFYDGTVAGIVDGRVGLFQNHEVPNDEGVEMFQFHWDSHDKKYLMCPYNPDQVSN